MAVTIEPAGGNLRILRLKGLLKKSELDAVLAAETRQWSPITHVKVLIIVEDFKGWEHGASWGDVFDWLLVNRRRVPIVMKDGTIKVNRRRKYHATDEPNPTERNWDISTTEEGFLGSCHFHLWVGNFKRMLPLSC